MAKQPMNEQEWLKGNDPLRLYLVARSRMNPRLKRVRRKFRLYACACCRMIWPLLRSEGQAAVEASERYADNEVGTAELTKLRTAASLAAHQMRELLRSLGGL